MELTRKQKAEIAGRNITTINNWCAGRYAMPAVNALAFNCGEQALERCKAFSGKSIKEFKVYFIAVECYFPDKFMEIVMLRGEDALDEFLSLNIKYSSIIRIIRTRLGKIMYAELYKQWEDLPNEK